MPPSFQERKADRLAKQQAESELAEKLRRARCPKCDQPLLWHDGPENDRARGVDCKLTQEQVGEQLGTKTVEQTD